MSTRYAKIILPTRPQPDTIVGIFLLRAFGKSKYPGVESAPVEVLSDLPKGETSATLEQKGAILIDVGGSKFDHHVRGRTASQLIAEDLGVDKSSALAKLLQYAERDDKYGLGTISQDSLDKAFGLSGLIASLNKSLPENPQKVVDYAIPLLKAHYLEEKKREDLPREFEDGLTRGSAEIIEARHKRKNMKMVALESDNVSMSGWLRSAEGAKADVVVQKTSAGFVNILTRPLKRIDLRWTAALLRQEEIEMRKRNLQLPEGYLMKSGRIEEVPEWYYDRATNSILNGGILHRGVEPTAVSFAMVKELARAGLEVPIEKRKKAAPLFVPDENAYFLEVRVPSESGKEIKGMLEKMPDGMKAHLPENYHITLMYFGQYRNEEVEGLLNGVERALSGMRSFSLFFDSTNFKAGIVPGYPQRSFYFEIGEENGGGVLRELRLRLQSAVSRFEPQEFHPHLTVATAMPNVEEKVTENAAMPVKQGTRVEFPMSKVRLTQVIKTAEKVTYRKMHEFILA